MIIGELQSLAPMLTGPEVRWAGAETLVSELGTLPTHSHLEERDFNRARGAVRRPREAESGAGF